MLRIKDNVDLKELEKFGFIFFKREYTEYYRKKMKTNGVKIFERDILKLKDGTIACVVWGEDYAQFVTRSQAISYEFEPLGDLNTDKIEVIGNIYDNPELLKGEQ